MRRPSLEYATRVDTRRGYESTTRTWKPFSGELMLSSPMGIEHS